MGFVIGTLHPLPTQLPIAHDMRRNQLSVHLYT